MTLLNPLTSAIAAPTVSRRRLIAGGTLALISAGLPGVALAQGRKTDTVRVTYGRGGLTLIAKERGEFEKRLAAKGIKVSWVGPFPNHAPSLQAVVGGSADFGFWGSSTPALAAILAGSPLVFTQFARYDPRSTAIIVKQDSGIHTIKDLAGKRVAVNRSGLGEFLLVAALEQNGVDRKAVQFVYLNPSDAAPAFGQGKVDAWSMWSPGVDIALDLYKAKEIFVEGKDLPFEIDFSSLVSSRQFVADNPELVREVIQAWRAEGEWISAHAREAELLSQKEGKYSDAVRERLIAYQRKYSFVDATDPTFLKQFQTAADWLSKRGILSKSVRVADHVVKL